MAAVIRPYIQVLAYGSPGEGKSHFFATFPKPMLVLSFDPMGKNKPYFKRGKLVPQPTIDEELGQEVWSVYSKQTPDKLTVSVEVWASLPLDIAFQSFITHRFNALYEEVRAGQWASVILDTLSSAELSARKMHELKLNKTGTNKDWAMGCTDSVEALVLKLLSLQCNVGVAAHVDKDKDDVLGRMCGMPSAPGRLQKKEGLAAKFPEIYRTHAVRETDGSITHTLQTRGDQRYLATSVFLEAPDPCLPDYKALWVNYDAAEAT